MKSSTVVYKRDESKMHNAPNFLPVLLSIEVILIIVSLIYVFVSILTHSTDSVGFLVFAVIAIVCIVHGTFCDYFYNWYENVRYEINNNKISYYYNLNECALSSNREVRIQIVSLTKFKLKGKKKVVLFGKFTKKAPLRNTKELNKITLQIDLTERDDIIKAFESIIERGM